MTLGLLWVVLNIVAVLIGVTGSGAQAANSARKDTLDETLPLLEVELKGHGAEEFREIRATLRKQQVKNKVIFALMWWFAVLGYGVTMYLITHP